MGGETFVIMIWFEELGLSMDMVSVTTIWFDVIINSGPVCVGGGVRVASEGKATLMGCTTKVCSSDKEGLLSESDCSIINDLLLAIFLNAMRKKIIECVALRWHGLNSG